MLWLLPPGLTLGAAAAVPGCGPRCLGGEDGFVQWGFVAGLFLPVPGTGSSSDAICSPDQWDAAKMPGNPGQPTAGGSVRPVRAGPALTCAQMCGASEVRLVLLLFVTGSPSS